MKSNGMKEQILSVAAKLALLYRQGRLCSYITNNKEGVMNTIIMRMLTWKSRNLCGTKRGTNAELCGSPPLTPSLSPKGRGCRMRGIFPLPFGERVRVRATLFLTIALLITWCLAPFATAKEFGVVEDLYVGRNTTTPYGGIGRYQNLLKYSEDFTQSSDWTATNVTPTNDQTAPNGEANTACLLTNSAVNGTVAQSATASASTEYTFSVWMMAGTSTTAQLELTGNAGDTATTQACTLTTEWQRFLVIDTTGASSTQITATIKNTGADTTTIKVWGAQLEQADSARVYVKTDTTAVATEDYGIVANNNLIITGTVDGRDLSVDGAKLDAIEAAADVTDATNVAAAGAAMDGDFTSQGLMKRGASAGTYSIVTDNSSNWDTAYTHSQATTGTLHGLTLADVSQLGSAIESAEITDATIAAADIASAAITKVKLSELAPTGNGDMTVAVAAAKVYVSGNTLVEFTGANATISAADATNPRIDLITLKSNNTLAVYAGTPLASPAAPSYPGDELAIAEVYVPANATQIDTTDQGNGYIYKDCRPFLNLGSTSLTVKEVDGDPLVSSVEILEIDQGAGLIVTDQGSNTARISLGSHWKDLYVDGADVSMAPTGEETLNLISGNDIDITANAGASPKALTFALESQLDNVSTISRASSNLTLQTTTSGDIIMSPAGNVGIGTTAPATELAVIGDAHLKGNDAWNEAGDRAILFLGAIDSPSVGQGHVGVVGEWGYGLKFGVYKSSGSGALGTDSLDAMVIKETTGYVGIATTNPGAALDVGGNFKVTSAGALTGASGNVSMWTNDSSYITDGNTNWDNSYGFITDDTSVPKGDLANSGTLGFDWADGEIADALTISSSGSVDAGAVKSGTLGTDRYSAYGDLSAEGYLGTDSTDLAIRSYVDTGIAGLSWKEAVLDIIADNTALPPDETTGNRYVLSTTGGIPDANWDGAEAGDMVEFDGSSWVEEDPQDGDAVFAEDEDIGYVYTGTAWTPFSGTSVFNAGSGLSQSGNTFKLGGTLSEATTITQGDYKMLYDLTGTGDFSVDDTLYVTDAGTVGIGITNPGYTLDVTGTINASAAIKVNDVDVLTVGGETDTTLTDDGSVIIGDGNSPTILTFNSDAGTDGTITWDGVADEFEIMGGEVGIGTTAPGEIFHISKAQNDGTVLRLENTANDTDVYTSVQLVTGTGADANKASLQLQSVSPSYSDSNLADYIRLLAESDAAGLIVQAKTGDIEFWAENSDVRATAEKMRIDTSANLSLAGDTDTYIGHPEADTLTVTIAGSEAVRIDNAGKLGIGTATPSAGINIKGMLNTALTNQATSSGTTVTSNLHGLSAGDAVKMPTGAASAFEVFTVASVTNGNIFEVDSTPTNDMSSSATIYKDPDLFAIDNGDATSKLIMDRTGNVGIGTSAPGEVLDVVGNAEVNGNIIVTGTVDGRDVAADGTKLDGIETSANNYVLPAATADTLGGIKVGTNLSIASGVLSATDTNTMRSESDVEGYIANDVTTGYLPYDNGSKLVTSNVYHDGSSSVGIGTTAPGAELAVIGDAHLRGNDAWNEAGDRAILFLGAIDSPVAGQGHVGVAGEWGYGLKFGVYKSSGGGALGSDSLDAMVIKETTGYVGIATTNPGAALDVGGNFQVTSAGALTGASGNISMWTNDSNFISDGNTNWDNSYGFITDDTVVPRNHLTNAGTLGFDWTNDEVADDLTISLSGSVNADAIDGGTLGTDRYSAYGDLSAEGYLGDNATTDLTSKAYVDNAIAGLKWKESVKAASTVAATLASDFANGDTIDGVQLSTGDRILVKDQGLPRENGIYVVTAGTPTRADDANTEAELVAAAVFIEQGTSLADTAFVCSSNTIPTIDTSDIAFVQFTGAAAYDWGNGLDSSGNSVFVGAGTGISVAANTVSATLGTDIESSEIVNGTIESADIADAAIAAADLASGAILKAKLNELRPHEQSTPNNTVYVEAGIISISENAKIDFDATSSPTFPVVSANPRIDLLTIDSSGDLGRTAGTEDVSPTAPTYPVDKLVIAEVTIDETDTVLINDADITDVRPFLNLGGGSQAIDDLTDVTITSAATGEYLRYSGAAWVDATIAASDIADGSVSNTEFQYLDGASSAIQTQIDGKLDIAPGSADADASANSSIHINDTGGGNLLQLKVSGADKFVVDATGNITVGGLSGGWYQAFTGSDGTGDGNRTFTLTAGTYVTGNNNILVFRNGMFQQPGASADYVETSNSVITFRRDVAANELIFVQRKGVIGTGFSGDITAVTAGTGLTDGGATGDVTLNIGAGTGITVNADDVAVDVGTTANKIVQLDGTGKLPAIDGSQLTNLSGASGDISGVTAGTGLTGGGDTGAVTLNVDGSATQTGLVQSTASGTSYITGGNVGIGTTGPGEELEVAGQVLVKTTNPLLILEDTDGVVGAGKIYFRDKWSNDEYYVGSNGSGFGLYDDMADLPFLYQSASNKSISLGNRNGYSDSGVNVNIQNTNDRVQLLIQGGSGTQTTDYLRIHDYGYSDRFRVDASGDIGLLARSSTTNHRWQGKIESAWYDNTDATRKADLVLSAFDTTQREGIRIRGTGSEAGVYLVKDGGNVGIGTTGPGAKLEVVGSADAVQAIIKANDTQTNTNPLLQFQDSNGTPIMAVHSDSASNVFIGVNAGDASTGTNNTFIGNMASYLAGTGGSNVAIGYEAGRSGADGAGNVFIGSGASRYIDDGGYNVSIGGGAGLRLSDGDRNIAIGRNANFYNQHGDYNIIIGDQAGKGSDAHDKFNNILIGREAGYILDEADNGNVMIGYQAGYNETGSNKLYIENSSATADSALIYGEFDNDILAINGNVGIGTTGPSEKLEIAGNISLGATDGNAIVLYESGGGEDNAWIQNVVEGAGDVGMAFYTTTDTGNPSTEKVRIDKDGNVGIGTTNPTAKLHVNGSVSKTSGSFDILHPDPAMRAEGWHLRHSFVESPTRGDNIYRWAVEARDGRATIELPDYFSHLNEDVQVWVSPEGHFGRAYGRVSTDLTEISLTADTDGIYNVLAVGTRKDTDAKEFFDELGVEYRAVTAEEGE